MIGAETFKAIPDLLIENHLENCEQWALMSHRDAAETIENVRSVPRTGLFLSAMLHTTSGPRPVRIRNLSSSGALVEGTSLPMKGASVHLERASMSASAEIRWSHGGRSGLEFIDPISMDAWVPSAIAERQMALDRQIAEVRKSIKMPEANADPSDLDERIAEELGFAMRTIAASLDELANFAPVVARHAKALQELEVTSQVLGHLARLIVSSDPASFLGSLGMDDLKRRLTRT